MTDSQTAMTPETKKEQDEIFADLILAINRESSGVTLLSLSESARDIMAMGGDQRDLLRVIRNNLHSENSMFFIKSVCGALKMQGVQNLPEIINESTLAAARKIQVTQRCSLVNLTKTSGQATRETLQYALTSPNYDEIAQLVEDRELKDLSALLTIIDERELLAKPIQNGAL